MRRLIAAAAVMTAGAAAGCMYAEDPEPYRPPGLADPGGAMSGEQLYQRDCAWCHGDRGEGTPRAPDVITGTNGPALTHYMLATGRMPMDDPSAMMRRGPVRYSEEDIGELVEYVTSLGGDGPDIPRIRPDEGDIALGKELYNENCAACHSTTGIGGTLAQERREATTGRTGRTSTFVAPGLERSSPTDIAEAVITGPGTMPVFENAFSEHELDSIVRHVLDLQEPENRGGAALGRVGPVVEGAVGWIVGLGFLLVLARWIGTRVNDA